MILCFSFFGLPPSIHLPSQVIHKSESHSADSWADGRWVFLLLMWVIISLPLSHLCSFLHPFLYCTSLCAFLTLSTSRLLFIFLCACAWLLLKFIYASLCDLCVIQANPDPVYFSSTCICSWHIGLLNDSEAGHSCHWGSSRPSSTDDDNIYPILYFKWQS